MPKKDRHNEDFDAYTDYQEEDTASDWEPIQEDEEAIEFERRQQGAKRESAKRARTAQKQMREREVEFSSNRTTDKRALQKDLKRHYTELKRLADLLDIKGTLQDLNTTSKMTTWGPDVISNKNRPSLAVVLNYIADSKLAGETAAVPSLFGVWLYYVNNQVTLAVATKTPGDTDSHSEQANPPAQRDRLLELSYQETQLDTIQKKLNEALRSQGPIS